MPKVLNESAEIIQDNGVFRVRKTTIQEEELTSERIYRILIELESRRTNLKTELTRIDGEIARYEDLLVKVKSAV